MKKFADKKIVVITGASKGLGQALAKNFSGPENILVLCDRSSVDVSKKKDIVKFIKTTLKKYSRIDILINNAGAIHKAKPPEKITDAEYQRCLKTNLDAVFYALRESIPSMKKRGAGTIVTISSTAGKRGNPDFAAYSTSKFAVTGLMQSAARYLDKYGVRCITIFPAGMNTAMRKYILGAKDANGQQSPESVAKIVKTAVKDPMKFPNGSEIEVRDGKIISISVI